MLVWEQSEKGLQVLLLFLQKKRF